MGVQQLIYRRPVPVTAERHGRCAVVADGRLPFARTLTSVPLLADEFTVAAQEHALVFADGAAPDQLLPVALLGARAGENLYLDDADRWRAAHVPAFLRRYPFVLSTDDGGAHYTLCVDEAHPGLDWQGRGRALFDPDGQPSACIGEVLDFLQAYRRAFLRSQALAARLLALDLLQPMQADFRLTAGPPLALTGFRVVDRARLDALDDATLAGLARDGTLECVQLHLQSLRHFQTLKQRLAEALAATPVAEATAAGSAGAARADAQTLAVAASSAAAGAALPGAASA